MSITHPQTLEGFKKWIHNKASAKTFCYDLCKTHLQEFYEVQDEVIRFQESPRPQFGCEFPKCENERYAILFPNPRQHEKRS